jgi:hypothetical protein
MEPLIFYEISGFSVKNQIKFLQKKENIKKQGRYK